MSVLKILLLLFTLSPFYAFGQNEKIQVLNFGTFHMGQTSDAHSTEFDENDAENKKAAHAVAEKLAKFNPTVIIVEYKPENNESLRAEYKEYIKNPDMTFDYTSEVELIAFEIGRLCKTERIYGIDHKMSYNYMIGNELSNQVDTNTYNDFMKMIPELVSMGENLPLLDHLKLINSEEFLNMAILGNADILTHVGTDNNFEGADEAAKYYQRNLRMFTNLNRIPLSKEDRVFILMGASHTAFFRDFISRSPKYEAVDVMEFLK